MRRTGAVLAAAALTLAGVTACSGGNDEYCKSAKDMSSEMASSFSAPSKSSLGSMADKFRQVADKAPDDIKPKWQEMADIMDKVGKASASDLKDLQSSLPKLQSDASAIEKDLKDKCS